MIAIRATDDEIAEWIARVISYQVEFDASKQLFRYLNDKQKQVAILEISRLQSIRERLSLKNQDSMALYDSQTYETAVKGTTPSSLVRRGIEISDSTNHTEYLLGEPSDEFVVYLLSVLARIDSSWNLENLTNSMSFRIERAAAKYDDALKLLKQSLPIVKTLYIKSETKTTPEKFQQYVGSFLFELCYNLNLSISPTKDISFLIREVHMNYNRRSKPNELGAPKRFYRNEITYYYQLGVASDMPSLEYLSYYHVLEYFFDEIYDDHLIEWLQQEITDPSFSYKRREDVWKVIKDLRNSLRIYDGRENTELASLKLTLAKYIDLNRLSRTIEESDPELLKYYQSTQVPFSQGNQVNFYDKNRDHIYKMLARRIYKTRNAIVHRKLGKGRYMPFRDEIPLKKEIPLLRFIAEYVIIGSSEMIV